MSSRARRAGSADGRSRLEIREKGKTRHCAFSFSFFLFAFCSVPFFVFSGGAWVFSDGDVHLQEEY